METPAISPSASRASETMLRDDDRPTLAASLAAIGRLNQLAMAASLRSRGGVTYLSDSVISEHRGLVSLRQK
jgi:hypothetical protein